MMKYILTVLVAVSFSHTMAQSKMGIWQDFLSYSNATKIAVSSDKIYCVTEGGLFYYNRQDNSVNKITGSNGLSDFGIKTITYSEINNVLIVAYTNSNIDLIYETGNC